MIAPALRERIAFARRVVVTDDYGATSGDWQHQFTVRARIWPRLGGEAVIAARLEGVQTVTITVRESAQTRQIGTDWKATNERTGVEYAVRSIVDAQQQSADHDRYIDVLCQSGVAA